MWNKPEELNLIEGNVYECMDENKYQLLCKYENGVFIDSNKNIINVVRIFKI